MSFDPYRDRHRDIEEEHRRRQERDSWTDIAYLIVAALGLVLVARLWSRVVQPRVAGLLAHLSVTQVVTAALVLLLVLAVAGRAWATHRRRQASRGLRVVNLPRHIRTTGSSATSDHDDFVSARRGRFPRVWRN